MKLNDKTVLVTGANRGIGRALVSALLSKGVRKVYAGARNTEALPDFGDPRVEPLRIDITDAAQVRDAAQKASDIDLLINNAGTAAFGSLLEAPIEQLHDDMRVNFYGTLDVVRNFVPVLTRSPDSAIVNVVTIAAFVNFPMLGGYSASKAALWSLSQGIRMELAAKGIDVHTVNPGPIDTDLAKDIEIEKTSPQDAAAEIIAGIERGDADIFPDAGSQQMFDIWRSDYRQLEQAVYEMHQAA